MNANKQDAGGVLPDELEAAIQDVADHANSDGDFVSNETERATENLRMKIRAYGEQCRAAPAGGDAEARDAARYRWLAENAIIQWPGVTHIGDDPASTRLPLDNAIDAAMRQEGGE